MAKDEAAEEIARVMAMQPAERERYFMSLPPDKTSTVLVEHLLTKPESDTRDKLVERARSYYYDDFKSICETCPKIQLRFDLLEAGYPDLAEEVVRGTYD